RTACQKAGMESWLHALPKETTQAQLLDLISQLNSDAHVHGILVQLPLPKQIDELAVIQAVSPAKDVDGFGIHSLGLLTIGQPRFLKADMVKPGAVVVDVGINRLPDGKLAGDVDFEAVAPIAAAISPVPGGVGPMTITMLLHNTLKAAKGGVGSGEWGVGNRE